MPAVLILEHAELESCDNLADGVIDGFAWAEAGRQKFVGIMQI